MNREMRRRMARGKKSLAEREMAEKLFLFDKLPNECSACEKPFDKKDKDMVTTWNVVVNNVAQSVRLYCPDCMEKARNVLKEYEGSLDE